MAERGRPQTRTHGQGRDCISGQRQLYNININQNNNQPEIEGGWTTVSHKRVQRSPSHPSIFPVATMTHASSLGSIIDSGLNRSWSGGSNRGRRDLSGGSSRGSSTCGRSPSNDSIGSSRYYVDVDLHGIKDTRDMKKLVRDGIFRKCSKSDFKVYIKAGAPKGENNMRKQLMEYLEALKTCPVWYEETDVQVQVRNFELDSDAVSRKERRKKGRMGKASTTFIIVKLWRLRERRGSLNVSERISRKVKLPISSSIIPRSSSLSSLSWDPANPVTTSSTAPTGGGMEDRLECVGIKLSQEETLMAPRHNEVLAKLKFISILVDTIIGVARTKATPLFDQDTWVSNSSLQRRLQQLLLYMRCLKLLSQTLDFSRVELKSKRLKPSTSVKNTLATQKEKFRHCLSMSKMLNEDILQNDFDPQDTTVSAEKLLYHHAIEQCQSAALDELFNNPGEYAHRYQAAHVLLHALQSQTGSLEDKNTLIKYRDAVVKRLHILEGKGYVYAHYKSPNLSSRRPL